MKRPGKRKERERTDGKKMPGIQHGRASLVGSGRRGVDSVRSPRRVVPQSVPFRQCSPVRRSTPTSLTNNDDR